MRDGRCLLFLWTCRRVDPAVERPLLLVDLPSRAQSGFLWTGAGSAGAGSAGCLSRRVGKAAAARLPQPCVTLAGAARPHCARDRRPQAATGMWAPVRDRRAHAARPGGRRMLPRGSPSARAIASRSQETRPRPRTPEPFPSPRRPAPAEQPHSGRA